MLTSSNELRLENSIGGRGAGTGPKPVPRLVPGFSSELPKPGVLERWEVVQCDVQLVTTDIVPLAKDE